MSKVLITGGAGFIGNSVVDNLYKKGKYEIVVLDSFSEQIYLRLY
ncbi:NAD-dependent epimerase/dehydratase family protein [Clostridium sp.]